MERKLAWNMLSKCWLLVLILICWRNYTLAQQHTDPDIADLIEWMQHNPDDALDYSELAERLVYFKKHPLNINKADENDLKAFALFNPLQINELLSHRRANGSFIALYELQSLHSFSLEDIQRLLPFISADGANPLKNIGFEELISAKHDILFRVQRQLQVQKGYTINNPDQSRYLGQPEQFLIRYKYLLNRHVSAALNMENDAGEQFFKGKSTGFDFMSGHIYLRDLGRFKKIVIGDYDLQFGQGLAMWSGLSFGKGPQIQTIPRQDVGLKPYSSINEGLFFRGIAATIAFGSLQFTPFYSHRSLDANLNEQQEVSAVNISGYHRTQTELAQRQGLKQVLYGTHLQWKRKSLHLGGTIFHTVFSRKFEAGKYPYSQFEFAGKTQQNYSINYNYTFKNTYFFGEAAKSAESGLAVNSGLITSLSAKLSLGLLYRNLPVNYHSFYNNAIAEASNSVNERGLYAGIQLKPHSKWEWSTYIDAFRFPWLKYGVDAPSNGFEVFSQLVYKPHKKLQVLALWRLEQKQQNANQSDAFNSLETVERQRYRLDVWYSVNRNLSFRHRLEMQSYQNELAHLLFQDILYKPLKSKISGNLRFAVFNIPSYDSRIYAYQNDVLYSYSIFAYQYQGFQVNANLRYRIRKGLDAWIHYESQQFQNRESIGSGLSEIEGNRRSEIKLQLRCQF